MSLWAVAAGPLLIGADIAKLDAETMADFTNEDLVAIDQDAAGLQGVKVAENGPGLEIWSKFLSRSGERAVLLLNRTYFPAPMHVDWKNLGLSGEEASVKDVWAAKQLGTVKGRYDVIVPAHDGVLLLVRGTEGSIAHYMPTTADNAFAGTETVFAGIPSATATWAQVRINYRNNSAETKIAELYVNGQTGTRVALPAVPETASAVWIQVRLDRNGQKNVLTFSNHDAVTIDSIDVH